MGSFVELILVPGIAAGHLVPAVEMAKVLVNTDPRVSVTVLLAKLPDRFNSGGNTSAESLSRSTASDRIKFVDLPKDEIPVETNFLTFLTTFYESQRHHVRDAVAKISSSRVAGFVLDMACTAMIDVADELGVPSYVFYTCGAGLHCLTTHLLPYGETAEIKDELAVPGFTNPIPKSALPALVLDKAWSHLFYDIGRGIKRSKGILVNSFEELEPGMFQASSSFDFPPAYAVGPLINVTPRENHGRWAVSDKATEIMEWLDGQPVSSVVLLCFGSMGSFGVDQVREIAIALEHTGVRFLWSLRRPGEKDDMAAPTPTDCENPSELLPEGFLERTAGIGKIVGWAPQVAVLAHVAVGGFVSHCGWNSVLESVWFGVPVATFPLYAEQHFNAFEMVKELGLSVEICMDNKTDILVNKGSQDTSGESVVRAGKIEMGIVKLMERDSDLRKKVKEMSEKSRKTLLHGGSSHTSLFRFITEIMD